MNMQPQYYIYLIKDIKQIFEIPLLPHPCQWLFDVGNLSDFGLLSNQLIHHNICRFLSPKHYKSYLANDKSYL